MASQPWFQFCSVLPRNFPFLHVWMNLIHCHIHSMRLSFLRQKYFHTKYQIAPKHALTYVCTMVFLCYSKMCLLSLQHSVRVMLIKARWRIQPCFVFTFKLHPSSTISNETMNYSFEIYLLTLKFLVNVFTQKNLKASWVVINCSLMFDKTF